MTEEPVVKLHASRKSIVLATSCQNLLAGSIGGGEHILEKVEEPPPRQGAPKERFYAAKSFATGSEGILPVFKPKFKTSFSLVSILRKLTNIRKIGHAGTLDPFAEGVMILLIGKTFTKLSNQFLHQDKEYLATVHLGIVTDTYDIEGRVVSQSSLIPSFQEIEEVLLKFQGTILQIPPMFSAKKVEGKKLYELARKGIVVERQAVPVTLRIELLDYSYPDLKLKVACSKGTYLRSLAYDIGVELGCGAHLSSLTRTQSGGFILNDCCDGARLLESGYHWVDYLKKEYAADYRPQ